MKPPSQQGETTNGCTSVEATCGDAWDETGQSATLPYYPAQLWFYDVAFALHHAFTAPGNCNQPPNESSRASRVIAHLTSSVNGSATITRHR